VLCGNAATIECRPWRTYDGGDHLIVIGEVTDVTLTEKPPLLFSRGKFREVGPFCEGVPWGGSADALACGWFEGVPELQPL
jgi:flavin reductase (DIM6/NTAB) family NADH-FMN oxidoreductase RutF